MDTNNQTTNTVVLSTSSYNQIKNTNYRADMFLQAIINASRLSEDHEHLEFDSLAIERALMFCYPETTKKKISYLRTQATKYELKQLRAERES